MKIKSMFSKIFIGILMINQIAFGYEEYLPENNATVLQKETINVSRNFASNTTSGSSIDMDLLDATKDVQYIFSKEDLKKIEDDLSGSYQLMEDIDLSGDNWIPIGKNGEAFTGELKGNGFAIKGLTIMDSNDYKGLFARLESANIQDLIFIEPNITASSYVGILSGYASHTFVSNVEVIDGQVNH
ncbi:hypothetical protein EDC19_1381 [Natranaerovirga hydrolytica]|uniref:Uncharacterized protein n=1 Tax=Natranaerovirga hydrolytica TaxID=680378 RepID=A0A4R1MMS0_9FIRM|nr:hypothetical protein [Natranaerovirga hydrolytica]TCK93192.1 hypothetical protein EDC19_1381 [Natranaerovirga hydrolytica]